MLHSFEYINNNAPLNFTKKSVVKYCDTEKCTVYSLQNCYLLVILTIFKKFLLIAFFASGLFITNKATPIGKK